MYQPSEGDTVRITFTGTVATISTYYGVTDIELSTGESVSIPTNSEGIDVEEVITVFGCGDMVRDTRNGNIYLIGETGYMSKNSGLFFKHTPQQLSDLFTSEHFERIEL